MKLRPIAISTLWAIVALAVTARAQETSLSGTVTDATDSVLPGVSVTALHVDTGNTFVAVSDTSGAYRIGAMRPGVYKVAAELPGFTTVTRENVELLVGQTIVFNVKMTLATVTETVTVSGQAPLLDVTQSKLGGNVDPRQLQALPVNGRNWMQLTMLAPGSRANDTSESVTGMGSGAYSDAGITMRTDPGYFQLLVDGQQVTNAMAQASYGQPKYSRDAIAEFQFISGRSDATIGRSLGIVVNAVTKSGTNRLLGSAYGYFRDDKFNAKDFVAKRVLPYANQQLGGTFGGPIVKDKIHYFGYYEGEREPTTLAFTSPFPHFNIADFHSTRAEHKAGVRFDMQLSQQTRLMVRANGWRNYLPVDPSGFSSASGHPAQNYSRTFQNGQVYGTLTKVFGRSTVNEIKPGFNFTSSDQIAICCATGPTINLRGYTVGKGGSWPLRLWPRIWSIRDDLTTVWSGAGRHEIRLGGDFFYNHDFLEWNVNRFGVLQANGGAIPANIQDLFPVWDDPSTWNLAPLAPVSVRFTQSFPRCVSGGCAWSWVDITEDAAAWLQDNWAVSSALTLNLGVRWDLAYNWAGQQLDFAPIHQKFGNEWANFSPRFGFAYTLPDKRTVLRGGWGKYFIGAKDQWVHHIKANIQLANVAVLNDGRPDFAANPFNGVITTYDQAVRLVHDTVGNVISNTVVVPRSYQGSIGFQRQLGDTMSIQADYVWNGGRHEETAGNTNLSYNPATGVNYPFSNVSTRPWPFLGITGQYFTNGESNYHGLETAFTKRMSRRWQASATYTLSRFRDFQPAPFSGLTPVTFPVADDIGNSWALAVGDQRHRMVFNSIWDLPYNLQVSGLYQYGSGLRYPTSYAGDLRDSGNRFNRLRPDGTIIPRNNFVGNPIHRVDLRVVRRFVLSGAVTAEPSLEIFNLFNHANYGSYVLTEGFAAYGQPQLSTNVAYQPRILQLGFRVMF